MRTTTQWKLAGPKTFRRGSSKLFKTFGSNVQNIEKSIREIYIPDGFKPSVVDKCRYWLNTGDISIFSEEELECIRVFLQTDQSGAEALIVAYDCVASDYRQLFVHNVKPHVYVALKLFIDIWKQKMKLSGGVSVDIDMISNTPIGKLHSIPEWKELDKLIKDSDNWSLSERYYYLAKQTVHSANYDIQPPKFRFNILEKSGGKILISKEDSEYFLQTYRGLFPEIPERNQRVRKQIDECGIIYNMHGHPYTITNHNITEYTYKEYYAWGPQSTVGEITRIAFSNLQEFIESEKKKWDILIDCHDSYLTQCPLMDVKECKGKMEEFMNQKMISPIDGTEFRMKSETNIGFNWSPFKKDLNELGLQMPKWMNN